MLKAYARFRDESAVPRRQTPYVAIPQAVLRGRLAKTMRVDSVRAAVVTTRTHQVRGASMSPNWDIRTRLWHQLQV